MTPCYHLDFTNRAICKYLGSHRKAHLYTDQNGRFGFTFDHDVAGGITLKYRSLGATKAAINSMTSSTRKSAKQVALESIEAKIRASFGIK